jgi:opine dehydrogenase
MSSSDIRTVAVLGAGHGGCAAAADLTRRGFRVRLHARSAARLAPLRERGGVEARGIQEGFVPLADLTTDVAGALDGADLIMLVVPSVAHAYYAEALAPLLRPDQDVFLNPGHTGGGLHFAHELRRAGYRDELQTGETVTLTYICRMEGPATVGIYSYVRRLRFAAFPGRRAEGLYERVRRVYPEIVPASSVLETGLANMNAVFHPPGMLMNAGWVENTAGGFRFYRDGITESVARVVAQVDAERMAIAKGLGVPARSFLDTFFEAGLTTAAAHASGSISRACRESEPNATIKAPASLDHRYVHEDVGYGLVPFAALGRLAGVPTPTIDAIVHLVSEATGIPYGESGLTLPKLGLAGKRPEDLAQFLLDGR